MYPRVRLTHADVSAANLQAPGVTWNLLRKVSIKRQQISRGRACSRCRVKKLKCDSGAPCVNCVKAKIQCDTDDCPKSNQLIDSADTAFLTDLSGSIERPLRITFYGSNFATGICAKLPLDLVELYTPQLNLFSSIFTMYGFPRETLYQMLLNLPPKLRLVLSHLGTQMRQETQSAPRFAPIPANADVWEGSMIGRQIIKVQNNSKVCAHNGGIAHLCGAHSEEITARMNSWELPPFTSEYRLLCLHLYLLLSRLRGVRQLTHFQPMFSSFCRPSSGGPRPVQMYRMTRTLYSDGEINVACAVQAEEYDAAVRVCPEARMEFVECDLAGRELSGTVLAEQEQIRHMAATAEGRAKLDRLADSVIDKFQLEIPPQSGADAVKGCWTV